MKYLLAGLVLFILSCLVYKYLLAEDDPESYKTALAQQKNDFTVPKDSAEIIWQRAGIYLRKNASLIGGGSLQENDSVFFLPYYSDHKKGSSIKIEKHLTVDSVSFLVQWWYSQKLQINGSKAIALFMQHNLEKSDFR